MKVECPRCGKTIVVGNLGRKPLNIAVNFIYDNIALGKSVAVIAAELGCSRGYIYQRLKELEKRNQSPPN